MERLNGYRIRLMFVGFTVVAVLGSGIANADFTWMQRTDMPTPRWMPTSAAVNGRIYVIGGVSSEPNGKSLSTVEEYDPVTDTWIRKADMPTARGWIPPSSPVVDGKIYVIGGGDDVIWDLPTVEEYDPATDTWMRKADMPTPRWCLATCAVNGKIYAIGGAPNSYTGLTVVEEYDPETDTWTTKADMPLGVWGLCACVVNGKIYAFGGRVDTQANSIVQEYDPTTDNWAQRTSMLINTSNMASVVLDDRILAIGGWLSSGRTPYKSVQEYDSLIDDWTQTAAGFPVPRSCLTACVLNNRIYAIGGTDRPHPCPALPTVYEFVPLLDFNGDGIVDSLDMCIMINHWGENYPSCDVAPSPFGDGIIDVEDLKVLAEHLFEEVDDPTLIAHWPFDEAQGVIAYNNVAESDGTLMGGPVWQPDDGIVDGAILLDGIDDYVSTDFILNPGVGTFSVVAWIKGGDPGQVVLSQAGAANWLCTDSVEGYLMTELKKDSGRFEGDPLSSEAFINDGNWHRVGFVWDGLCRRLYVDGVEVASDAEPLSGLNDAYGGLYIGTGSNCAEGSFFSGLIDDVRIYNRVVNP